MYTHKEFLEGIENGTLTFRVNPLAHRTETEARLSKEYRRAVSITKGASMALLLIAVPLYLLSGWLLAALSVGTGISVFLHFRSLNYRVFVRAQAKENEGFFERCQKNSAIIIMKTGKVAPKIKKPTNKTKVLIATHNQSKLKRYRDLLAEVEGLELVSLKDLNIKKDADEPYKSSAKNAAHKAKFYGDLSKVVTVANDGALTTNFLPPDSQPGVLVRRIRKNRGVATDKELLAFWKETISLYDTENKKFIWDSAIAYYDPATKRTGSTKVERIDSVAKKFSTKILPGYPMSAFLIGPGLKKPYSELSEPEAKESDLRVYGAFLEDFSKWIEDSR